MARFYNLFSSSKGNCTYIGTTKSGILIDAGMNAKQIRLALEQGDIEPSAVKGVFITHEHTDHVSGLRVFCSQNNIPVFSSKGTYSALESKGVFNGKFFSYVIDNAMEIADMMITPFNISHDCSEGYGYCIQTNDGRKISVCTDTGYVTDEIRANVKGSDLVLLESNHDVGMLKCGAYPYPLKQRILSDVGHLSNEVCAEFAKELVSSGTTRLVLGHLSEENNYPDLAYQTTLCEMTQMGAKLGTDYTLTVAPPKSKGEMIIL